MVKSSLKNLLVASGALRLGAKFVGGGVAILMYHSVREDASADWDFLGGISHPAPVFRGQMELLARHFNPVSLDDVSLYLRGRKELGPRSVAVTFDDGYADNYGVARPILDQVGIPAIFYVAVDSIENQTFPWPGQLRHAFLSARAVSWTDAEGKVRRLEGREERLRAFEAASARCAKLCGEAQKAFLDRAREDLGAEPIAAKERPMMSWDELRLLVQGGHLVGSHTMTHPNMAHVPETEARAEFSASKRRLDEQIGNPVVHFSYPCPALQPHWADHTVDLSRQAGYETGVTTDGGLVRKGDNSLRLHRIRPTRTVRGIHWNLEYTFMGGIA
jgi:peptidoglycan/xylan/chitin deacetylase (PgdA/CDA1 family)